MRNFHSIGGFRICRTDSGDIGNIRRHAVSEKIEVFRTRYVFMCPCRPLTLPYLRSPRSSFPKMSFLHDFFLGFNTTFAVAICVVFYVVMYYCKYIWPPDEPDTEALELEKLVYLKEVEVKQLAAEVGFVCVTISDDPCGYKSPRIMGDDNPRRLVDFPLCNPVNT